MSNAVTNPGSSYQNLVTVLRRKQGFLSAKFSAVSVYLPNNLVSNIDVVRSCEQSESKDFKVSHSFQARFQLAEKIFANTGIVFRRYAHENECTSDLAWKSLQPIFNKHVASQLICATTSPNVPSPATAHAILNTWGISENCSEKLSHVLAFDVASSCSSFLSALKIAAQGAQLGEATVLCVAELKHKSLSQDLRTRSLFSDGAVSFLVEPNSEKDANFSGFLFAEPIVDAHLVDHIKIPMGGTQLPFSAQNENEKFLRMLEPKFLYRHTVKRFVQMIEKLWVQRNSLLEEMFPNCSCEFLESIPGLIYLHQANKKLLEDVVLKLTTEISRRVIVRMNDTGNMVSAAMPALFGRVQSEIAKRKGTENCFVSDATFLLDTAKVLEHPQAFLLDSEIKQFEKCLADFDSDCAKNLEFLNGQMHLQVNLFVVAGGGFQTSGCLAIKVSETLEREK
jgi:3-oxoacyl-[acyl-carrier-protein] synthase III